MSMVVNVEADVMKAIQEDRIHIYLAYGMSLGFQGSEDQPIDRQEIEA